MVSSASSARGCSTPPPSTTTDQVDCTSIPGGSSASRRLHWSRSSATNAGGPPASRCTPAGRPSGSTPTVTTVDPRDPSTRRNESLPASPPKLPNSSPATSTSCGPTPRAHRSSNTHCPECDLSVSPISTCFTSVVTRASSRPTSRAASSASCTTWLSPCRPTPNSRSPTASSSSSMRALGASIHSGVGMMSIFRRLSRSETIAVSSPNSASRRTVSAAARSSFASSSGVASRRHTSRGPASSTSKTSDPRLSANSNRPGPDGRAHNCPSMLPTCVPLTIATIAPAAQSRSTSSRTSEASASRSGTAVPSQSKTNASKRRSSGLPGGTGAPVMAYDAPSPLGWAKPPTPPSSHSCGRMPHAGPSRAGGARVSLGGARSG